MPFPVPTLRQLRDRARADFAAGFGLPKLVGRGIAQVTADVQAGLAKGSYGYIGYIARNHVPHESMDTEVLERWANLRGLARKSAVAAVGNVDVTGITGASVPAGSILQRADQVQYSTDEAATLVSGAATIPVTAILGGEDGNADAGVGLTFVTPVSGVEQDAAVSTGGITGGSEIEDDVALYRRLRLNMSEPPAAGSAADYERWMLEVGGVTRAWALAGTPPAVDLYFATDGESDPFPTTAKQAEVQAYIDARRPLGATVTVNIPLDFQVNITLKINPTGDLDLQEAVEQNITDLLTEDGGPGATIPLTHLRQAVKATDGVFDYEIVSPTGNISVPNDSIATLGTVTWQAWS